MPVKQEGSNIDMDMAELRRRLTAAVASSEGTTHPVRTLAAALSLAQSGGPSLQEVLDGDPRRGSGSLHHVGGVSIVVFVALWLLSLFLFQALRAGKFFRRCVHWYSVSICP